MQIAGVVATTNRATTRFEGQRERHELLVENVCHARDAARSERDALASAPVMAGRDRRVGRSASADGSFDFPAVVGLEFVVVGAERPRVVGCRRPAVFDGDEVVDLEAIAAVAASRQRVQESRVVECTERGAPSRALARWQPCRTRRRHRGARVDRGSGSGPIDDKRYAGSVGPAPPATLAASWCSRVTVTSQTRRSTWSRYSLRLSGLWSVRGRAGIAPRTG